MGGKLLKFASPEEKSAKTDKRHINTPWNILVVDDDQSIHDVTRLILSDFYFDSRPLKLTFAYSAKEARDLYYYLMSSWRQIMRG